MKQLFSKHHPKPVKNKDRCCYITKSGQRCKKPSRIGNICLSHYILLTKKIKRKEVKQ